jgi:hypothetical protein
MEIIKKYLRLQDVSLTVAKINSTALTKKVKDKKLKKILRNIGYRTEKTWKQLQQGNRYPCTNKKITKKNKYRTTRTVFRIDQNADPAPDPGFLRQKWKNLQLKNITILNL